MIDLDQDPGRKEVFAHFGFAVGVAQNVERLLGRLVVLPDLAVASSEERQSLVREVDMSTLGDLRKRFVKLGEPGLADTLLHEVNKMRNMAVHRFFWDDRRSVLLNSPAGQATLIAELDTLATEWLAVEGHIRTAMIRLGLHLTQSANPVIQRIRALQRGEAVNAGPFTEEATRLVQGSPESVERAIAQLEAAAPEAPSP